MNIPAVDVEQLQEERGDMDIHIRSWMRLPGVWRTSKLVSAQQVF